MPDCHPRRSDRPVPVHPWTAARRWSPPARRSRLRPQRRRCRAWSVKIHRRTVRTCPDPGRRRHGEGTRLRCLGDGRHQSIEVGGRRRPDRLVGGDRALELLARQGDVRRSFGMGLEIAADAHFLVAAELAGDEPRQHRLDLVGLRQAGIFRWLFRSRPSSIDTGRGEQLGQLLAGVEHPRLHRRLGNAENLGDFGDAALSDSTPDRRPTGGRPAAGRCTSGSVSPCRASAKRRRACRPRRRSARLCSSSMPVASRRLRIVLIALLCAIDSIHVIGADRAS